MAFTDNLKSFCCDLFVFSFQVLCRTFKLFLVGLFGHSAESLRFCFYTFYSSFYFTFSLIIPICSAFAVLLLPLAFLNVQTIWDTGFVRFFFILLRLKRKQNFCLLCGIRSLSWKELRRQPKFHIPLSGCHTVFFAVQALRSFALDQCLFSKWRAGMLVVST